MDSPQASPRSARDPQKSESPCSAWRWHDNLVAWRPYAVPSQAGYIVVVPRRSLCEGGGRLTGWIAIPTGYEAPRVPPRLQGCKACETEGPDPPVAASSRHRAEHILSTPATPACRPLPALLPDSSSGSQGHAAADGILPSPFFFFIVFFCFPPQLPGRQVRQYAS